ncbi:sensor histidine kinase [Paenibacillus sp.]|uniref:sensor histidine kinase n=1 Tax=Paenibacillus sp. TaxID=58172 RepID=UPI002D529290|nr:histidine kinase [Paenibacillus sp.]HZG84032.1 histidine kinase [Paenibacillus sp.]
MKVLLRRLSWNSVRVKLVLGIIMLVLPLILFLYFIVFYATGVIHEQVAKSNKNMISLYMGQIDQGLDDVNGYLLSLTMNSNLISLVNTTDHEEYLYAKQSLSSELSAGVFDNKLMDAMFIYDSKKDQLIDAFTNRTTFSRREAVRNYIRTKLATEGESSSGNHWYAEEIGQDYYIFRVISFQGIAIGAWVSAESLLTPLEFIELGERGTALFATSGGVPMDKQAFITDHGIRLDRNVENYYFSGDEGGFLVIGASSKAGPFRLVAIIQNSSILEALPFLNQVIYFITAGLFILIPCFFIFLRKLLLTPLQRIMSAMKLIGEGNVNMRMKTVPTTSDEFVVLNQTFNRMMEQIDTLKIKVYEEQINKQKAELQHLQLQINPHFFMNSLNILYNLALVKNFDLIREMTMCLVRYFRYMFRSNLSFVPLADEIQHVRNFLRIQELRFPESLHCQIHVPQYLKRVPIPPLCIQTFVENAIKHSVTLDERIRLQVKVELDEQGPEPQICIEVKDSGKGFADEILNQLRAGERIVDDQGDHIGIWNVRHRLRLLYQDRAYLGFHNAIPRGAVVEMKLPLNPRLEEEGSETEHEAVSGR